MQKLAGLLLSCWLALAPAAAQNFIVPTAPNGASNNQAASTAFVQNAFAGGAPTESANAVFAGPTSGVPAGATWRLLVGADLPFPTVSTLGGVEAITCSAHAWINTINSVGVPVCTQINFTDLAGSAACTQLPALTSDVTTSAGSCVTTIANAAVTYAKMQNVAASRLLGNPTGAPASPSEITLGATLAFSGSALQTGAGTGDVAWSANGFVTTIQANAVTGSKIATNTVANSNLAQGGAATLKGNPTAGTANEQDFTLQGLTALATPSPTLDFLLIYDHSAGTLKSVTPNAITGTSSALALLNTLTASNSATLSDTTSLTSTYSKYRITFENIVPATTNQPFELQVSVNGGSSYLNASYVSLAACFQNTGTTTSTTYIMLTSNANTEMSNNSANNGINGEVIIYTPSKGSNRTSVNGHSSYLANNALFHFCDVAGYQDGANTAINAIQFLMGSGNITSGTIHIYGML